MKMLLLGLLGCSASILIFSIVKFRHELKTTKWLMVSAIIIFTLVIYLYDFSITKETTEAKQTEQRLLSKLEHPQLEIVKIKDKVLLDAPLVKQLPELPRGCEVTSLAMLLEDAGVKVDKMELAKKVKKDPAKRVVKDGKIYFGNPHKGFVGNMYTFNKPGFGVYHEPIMELADQYLPNRIVNLTGQSFEELKIPLSQGYTVWVIINAEYRKLDDSYFQTWYTQEGKVRITMKEHSVLITGYDQKYVYFNDPLTGQKNKKAPIKDFNESWVQMGSQALTFTND